MSEEHVEIARQLFDALNREDPRGALKHAAPDFVFDFSRSVSPERGVYTREEFPSLFDSFNRVFTYIQSRHEALEAAALEE